MTLGFVFDTRFIKYRDQYYSTSLSNQMLTERYLIDIERMIFVGRYKETDVCPTNKYVQVSCDNIAFHGIKDEHPIKRIFHFRRESKKIREALEQCDVAVCRGWRGTGICRKLKKPYLVEVVNCAWDSYWNHGLLGKLVAPIMYGIRRITTKKAPYVLYVTNEFLQRRYPTNGKSVSVSDVALAVSPETVLHERLQKIANKPDNRKLVIGTAAAIDVPFKGQRFIIKALAKLKKRGIQNIEYQLAGAGTGNKLRKLAEKLGVSEQVVFCGSIVHDDMFRWFDSLDIYIQPSLQEGLPRALIEAMSRGLPCYGTKTGGIPELLEPTCVCCNNYRLADKFAKFLLDYDWKNAQASAKRNFVEAQKYSAELLRQRREAFFRDFYNI